MQTITAITEFAAGERLHEGLIPELRALYARHGYETTITRAGQILFRPRPSGPAPEPRLATRRPGRHLAARTGDRTMSRRMNGHRHSIDDPRGRIWPIEQHRSDIIEHAECIVHLTKALPEAPGGALDADLRRRCEALIESTQAIVEQALDAINQHKAV